ncbi:pyridoxamine 5'-phosphate oxidase family protein [Paracoccaceae bacterium GXU_MW_L88]
MKALDRAVEGAVLLWLATADEKGKPNVSPKEIWVRDGDYLLIADIASARSVENLRANPQASASFIDILRQKGVQTKGRAEIIGPDDEDFAEVHAPLAEKAGPDFPIRNVIRLNMTEIFPIIAPSYALQPEKSEAERIAEAKAAYGFSAD